MTTTTIVGGQETRIGSTSSDNGKTPEDVYMGDGDNVVRTDRILTKFDLSSISGPITVTNVNITFWLYYAYAANNAIPSWSNYLYRCLKPWTKLHASWTNYNNVDHWAADGCSDDTDRDPVACATFDLTKDQSEILVTIASTPSLCACVQDMVNNPSSNDGWLWRAPALEGLGVQRDTDIYTSTNTSGRAVPTIIITYSAAPAPGGLSISPNAGSTVGFTPVSIFGTGFVDGATVTIGGNAATGVTFVSSTQLNLLTPPGTAGRVDVVVTNPDLQTGTLTNGYTYLAPSSSRAGGIITTLFK